MLSLLSEIHFWTTKDEIILKDNDYGIFHYRDKKDSPFNVNAQSKRSYAEKRDYRWNLTSKRPFKLKDKLKELEEHMVSNKIVYCNWPDNNVLTIIFNTGLIAHVYVNMQTGDVLKISYDKYLTGRLPSETITDVLITRSHMLISYSDNQLTIVHFGKILVRSLLEKIGKLEPKIVNVELAGPPGRKLERTLDCNLTGDIILTSWRCVRDEVYPWSPIVKDQDRANVHLYHLKGSKIELLCFLRTECDPLNLSFSKVQQYAIHCVEQKVSRKGQVTVDTCTFELVRNQLEQLAVTTIPLQTQVCCNSFSPDYEKLLLGCIDGSIVLFDQATGVTQLVKAAFIPSIVKWHPDGAIVMIANEKSQIQCFDISVLSTNNQIISEEITPSPIIDLSSNFKSQPTLLRMEWNEKVDVSYFRGSYLQTDSLLLLMFEKGPLAVMRLFSSSGLRGDIQMSGLTPDNLVYNYVTTNHIDRAVSILSSLNWDTYGVACLLSLQRITNHLFRQRLTPEREEQIQRALGSFYVPVQPVSATVVAEFGDQVKDIARKFFHLLVRYRLFEKAFCLAIDINDYDLFMDLYYYAQMMRDDEMARASLNKAKDLINMDECSHSTCSRSSCSQCSDDDGKRSDDESNRIETIQQDIPPLPVTNKPTFRPSLSNYTPPLPVMKPPQHAFIPPFPQIRTTPTPPRISPISNLNYRFPSTDLNFTRPRPVQTDLRKSVLQNSLPIFDPKPLRIQPKLSTPVNYLPSFGISYNENITPREIVHRTISFNIPPPPSITNSVKRISGVPCTVHATPLKLSLPVQNTGAIGRTNAEKNVKFSDTVTAFIVPEIQRTEKPKEKTKRPSGIYITDPKQELADSLPLCSPNEEYLKDFTPISNSEDENEKRASKIQVVHFGMV